jgi:hypothetical protein
MWLRIILAFVLGPLSSCSSTLCELLKVDQRAPSTVFSNEAATAAPLHDGTVLIASQSRRGANAVDVTRVTAGGEERVAELPPLTDPDPSWALQTSKSGWWFSRWGSDAEGSAIFFAVDGTLHRQRLNSLSLPQGWLPVRSAEARGVLLSVAREQPALRVDEVTPSGVKHLASFSWWQTSDFLRTLLPSRWTAEFLGEGRYAVLGVDGEEGSHALTLRLIDHGKTSEQPLGCAAGSFDYPIASAYDGKNTIALAGRTAKGEVLAMRVDITDPATAVCRVLSAQSDSIPAPQYLFGPPDIAWRGDGFVIAWITSDGTVRASELGTLQRPPIVVTIAHGANGVDPLRQLVHVNGDAIVFTWRDSDARVVTQSMPAQFTAVALVRDLRDTFCRWTAAGASP